MPPNEESVSYAFKPPTDRIPRCHDTWNESEVLASVLGMTKQLRVEHEQIVIEGRVRARADLGTWNLINEYQIAIKLP